MSGCDGCTMCCKLMQIDEINKPYNEWCKDCIKGSGCGIYESRPEPCKIFQCVWLYSQSKGDQAMPPEMRPDRCHVVICAGTEDTPLILHVDPARPNAWKTKYFQALINKWAKGGLRIAVAYGKTRKLIRGSHDKQDLGNSKKTISYPFR